MKILKFPSLDYKHKIQAFIATTHSPKHPLLVDSLFDWFYKVSQKPHLSFYLALGSDNNIVSILGFYSCEFLLHTQLVPGVWTALWFTLPSYRNGIGALLMKELVDSNSVVCGLGASAMNIPIARALGYKTVDKIYNFVFILDSLSIRKAFKSLPLEFKQFSVSNDNDLCHSDCCHHESLRNSQFEPCSSVNARSKEIHILQTFKSADYIRWRYVSHPFFDYHVSFIVDSSGHSVFYLIWRLVDLNGLSLCRIVDCDYLPESPNLQPFAQKLIYSMLSHLSCMHVSYVDCFTNDTILRDILSDFGFTRDSNSFFPNLIDPIDYSRPDLNCEYYVDSKLYSNVKMFNMRGDGDQDRPNQSISV